MTAVSHGSGDTGLNNPHAGMTTPPNSSKNETSSNHSNSSSSENRCNDSNKKKRKWSKPSELFPIHSLDSRYLLCIYFTVKLEAQRLWLWYLLCDCFCLTTKIVTLVAKESARLSVFLSWHKLTTLISLMPFFILLHSCNTNNSEAVLYWGCFCFSCSLWEGDKGNFFGETLLFWQRQWFLKRLWPWIRLVLSHMECLMPEGKWEKEKEITRRATSSSDDGNDSSVVDWWCWRWRWEKREEERRGQHI